jgi:hypothetical protein
MDAVNELFDQLQHELAGEEYGDAQRLIEEISQQLELLKDPQYQNITSMLSNLDPNQLDGAAYKTASDIKNQLKDLVGIGEFENYLASLKKYIEALMQFGQGDLSAAMEAIGSGRSLLGKGTSPSYPDLQRYYTGLEYAFSSLEMQIRGYPDLG